MTENSSSKADAMEIETGSKELRIVTSVARTLAILERLSEQRCIHLEHLAMKTGLPKPTLHRFLASLVELGYVHRDANDRYSLTLRMLGIGSRGLAHMDMQETAYPVARQLGEHLHETVHMGVLDEDMAMYILKIESRYTLRMYSRIGKRIPLYCTAIGKVLLSGMREDQLEAYLLQSETIPFTRNTITDPLRLKEQLETIKVLGYAQDIEEHEDGIRCIAAGVTDYSGQIVAGISVSWPVFRFKTESTDEYISLIKAAAQTISRTLGSLP